MSARRWLPTLLAATLACTPGEGDDTTPVVLPVELDGACPLNERVGLFRVAHEPDYSSVDGEILDAVLPASIQELIVAEAGCRLLTRINPICEPACMSGQTCAEDGTCVPYPARIETGTVTVAGLEVAVAMEPRADLRYFETTLPHPVFRPGAPLSLTSAGGEVEALALSGVGVEPLELDASPWILAAGQATTLTWASAGEDGDATIYASINVDQHGLSPATLECEGPDTGSLEIPAAVVDALLAAGVSGFPTGQAYRRTVDSMAVEVGCVELQVVSHQTAAVEVAGHTPCTDDADCPAPQTCDLMLQSCS